MKVVCIDHLHNTFQYPDEIMPVKGQIYTVRNTLRLGDITGYYLVEIINKPKWYQHGFMELAYNVTHFRPVTDISALTELTKVKELEDA